MNAITIRPVRFGAPVSTTLIKAAVADLAERYGGDGDATPIVPLEFDPPGGAFLVAWIAAEPAGCGGWRTHPLQEHTGEIKRMYTVPTWRRKGVGRAMLAALEDSARSVGKRRLILETGLRQPEAIALYERQGYVKIEKYGYYKDHDDSVCYGRDL